MDACIVIDDQRFRDHMTEWAAWHKREPLVEGHADSVPVLASNRSRLFVELCEDVDTWVSEVIESEVNDLPPNERVAVHHVWLHCSWRPAGPLEDVYGRARDRLIDRLSFRGIE